MVGHVKRCLRDHPELHCVTAFESLDHTYEEVFYHADQVLKSMYAPFMEGWMQAFPGAVLPIRLEDYASGNRANLREVLERAVAHLGLAPLEGPVLNAMLAGPIKKQGEALLRMNRGTMEPKTQFELQEFFRPYNRRLANLLDDERWLWGY
jgi:N-acetylgalactosamine 4-sulfate 6-O-sulfotransferase